MTVTNGGGPEFGQSSIVDVKVNREVFLETNTLKWTVSCLICGDHVQVTGEGGFDEQVHADLYANDHRAEHLTQLTREMENRHVKGTQITYVAHDNVVRSLMYLRVMERAFNDKLSDRHYVTAMKVARGDLPYAMGRLEQMALTDAGWKEGEYLEHP